jgi:hypothetical protein
MTTKISTRRQAIPKTGEPRSTAAGSNQCDSKGKIEVRFIPSDGEVGHLVFSEM